jgi:hypothetical protein
MTGGAPYTLCDECEGTCVPDLPHTCAPPAPPAVYVCRKTAEWWPAPRRPALLEHVDLFGKRFERLTPDLWAWLREKAVKVCRDAKVPADVRKTLQERMQGLKRAAVAQGIIRE